MNSNQDRIRETFSRFPIYLASETTRATKAEDARYLMMPVGSQPGTIAHDLALLVFTSQELCQEFLKANSDLGPFLPAEVKSAKTLATWMHRHPFRGPAFGWIAVDPPTDLSTADVFPTTAVLLFLDTLLEP